MSASTNDEYPGPNGRAKPKARGTRSRQEAPIGPNGSNGSAQHNGEHHEAASPAGGGLPPLVVSTITYSEPAGKAFAPGEGSAIKKIPLPAHPGDGVSGVHKFATFSDFCAWRVALGATVVGVAGTFEANGIPIGTKEQAEDDVELISRTKDYLSFRDDPGVLIGDADVKTIEQTCGRFPVKPMTYTPGSLVALIRAEFPELAGVPIMAGASTSSGIVNGSGAPSDSGGVRYFIPMSNASDIPEQLLRMHQRLVAAGYGWGFVDTAGRTHLRSPVDLAMRTVTQPDYCAPDLRKGLVQDRGWVIDNGTGDGSARAELVAPADVKAFTDAAGAIYGPLVPAQDKQREIFAASQTERLRKRHKSATFSEKAVVRAIETSVLTGDVPVEFGGDTVLTVQELLNGRGAEFDGKDCHDPLEPGYRPGVAMGRFFWNGGDAPCIHSMAHGGHTYVLRFEPGAVSVATNIKDAVRILALTVYDSESEEHADKRSAQSKFKATIKSVEADVVGFINSLRARGINFKGSGGHHREQAKVLTFEEAAEDAARRLPLDIADLTDGRTILAQLTAHWRLLLSANGVEAVCFRNEAATEGRVLLRFRSYGKKALVEFCERFGILVGYTMKGTPIFINPAKKWFEEVGTSTRMVTFDPGAQAAPGIFNLWTGFAVQPGDPGGCPLFLQHVKEVIANGDPEIYEYVLNWLAARVQGIANRVPGVPLKRMVVNFALRSIPGTGKGQYEIYVHGMFGDVHSFITHRGDGLAARFNYEFANKVLICADEAFYAGDAKAHAAMKSYVSEPVFTFEQKFKDAVSLPNHAALILSTNEDWVVPADMRDRRWCVLDVASHRVGDRDYFNALAHERENGGPANLLAFLLARDISRFNIDDYPKTEALAFQKARTVANRDPVMAWLAEALDSGVLPRATSANGRGFFPEKWTEDATYVTKEAIRQAVAEEASATKAYHGTPATKTIGATLKKVLGGGKELRTVRLRDGGERARAWVVPGLSAARKAYDKYMGQPNAWDDAE